MQAAKDLKLSKVLHMHAKEEGIQAKVKENFQDTIMKHKKISNKKVRIMSSTLATMATWWLHIYFSPTCSH
jgi:hypothetical protein